MKTRCFVSMVPAALLVVWGVLLAIPVSAEVLNVVPVSAPAINCIFNTECTVSPVHDRVETFQWFYNTGQGRLQSRVWRGQPGSAAAGLYAYLYHVDLSGMQGSGSPGCVARVSVPAPASAIPMDFNGDGQSDDHVFVITQGGPGEVAPETASASVGKLWFDLGDNQVSSGVCPGQGSFFFGFVSARPPALAKANLEFYWLEPTLAVPVYAPGVLTFSIATQPVGPVTLASLTNLMVLTNLPATGGGFEVDLGESQGWLNSFSGMELGRSGEYAITMQGRGTMGLRGQPFLGTASLWVSNRMLYASADFSSAGTEYLVYEFRGSNGVLLAEGIETPGNPLMPCGLPLCGEGMTFVPLVCSNAFVSLNGEPAACWTFCQDACTLDPECESVRVLAPVKTICVLGKNPAVGPVQAITNVQVLLSGIGSVTSPAQFLRSSNAWHAGDGNGVIRGTPAGIEMNKASIGDQGGLTTLMFPAHLAEFAIPWLLPWSNSLPRLDIGLLVSGATSMGEQHLASLAFEQVRGVLQMTADFNPLGSPQYQALVFLGTGEVGSFEQAGPIVISEGPARVTFARPGFTAYLPPSPCFLLKWDMPLSFQMPGAAELRGDTLLLLAENPTLEVLHVNAMTFRGSGVPALALSESRALPAVQVPLVNFSLNDGTLQGRADTLPGVRYFLEMTPELGRSVMWETGESFIGNGFSRSLSLPAFERQGFFRLRIE